MFSPACIEMDAGNFIVGGATGSGVDSGAATTGGAGGGVGADALDENSRLKKSNMQYLGECQKR
jgi:hypothetical protein